MWRYLAVVIATIAALTGIVGFSYHAGARTERAKWLDKEAAQAKADLKAQQALSASSATVQQQAQAAAVETRWRTRVLIQKVVEYVPAAADAHCVVNNGALRVLNAAAQDRDAGPATDADAAASGALLSQLVAVQAANLGSANLYAGRVRAWERWACGAYDALGQKRPEGLACGGPGTFAGDPPF